MKTVLSLLWLLIVPLAASSLIAVTDADVDGFRGLADFGAMMSVFSLSFIGFALLLLATAVWHRRGFRPFLLLAIPLSVFISFCVTAAGSTATGLVRAGSLVVLSAMIFAAIVLAVWPVTWTWSRTAEETEAGV